ncbi:MAG TPA: response regulator [Candidatus Dormibacteraeota bacterium]|nr:response regulator [Candidatus Dormibacteraeota bacterium]
MKHRVLVVEDNEANQLLAASLLEREGYDVDIASTSVEAVASIGRRTPDLILMDVQLPGEDGLSFTRRLRSDHATSGIRIVALTALAMAGDRERTLEAGCDGYISKPIDTRTFAQDISKYLPNQA